MNIHRAWIKLNIRQIKRKHKTVNKNENDVNNIYTALARQTSDILLNKTIKKFFYKIISGHAFFFLGAIEC